MGERLANIPNAQAVTMDQHEGHRIQIIESNELTANDVKDVAEGQRGMLAEEVVQRDEVRILTVIPAKHN